jgi:cobalamin biosynthesis Mg chelatase CobN
MLGSRRHLAHGWDRSVFVLLSVLALLAFALFPVAASADSAGYEYENAVPTPTGGTHKAPTVVGGGNEEEDDAHASKKGGGSGGTGSGSDGGSSEGGNADTPATQGSGDGKDGNGSTTSQHPNGGKDAGQSKVANFEEVPSPSAESDDGGSSPLVPILIVIALLAAISVGVVVWQRRRGDAPPITPKAG